MKSLNLTIALVCILFHANAQIRITGTNVSFGTNHFVIVPGSTSTSNVIIGNGTGSGGTGINNVFLGNMCAISNTTGNENTFIGRESGRDNTIGSNNSFIGSMAGANNTSGESNTFVGQNAGMSNSTGSYNVYMGAGAGQNNTSGHENIFVGPSAGYFNTSGTRNIYVGSAAGQNSTTAQENIFVGPASGWQNVSGSYNVFLGSNSGQYNTIGNENTFVGQWAGRSNTSGSSNVFLGSGAGSNNTTASENTFIGKLSGLLNSTGSNNVYIGTSAGESNSTGNENTFVGYHTGLSNTVGSGNTYLGNASGTNSTGSSANDNTFVGNASGYNNESYNNSFFGKRSGSENKTGSDNSYFGTNSGYNNIAGSGNSLFGSDAGVNNAVDSNSFFGARSGNKNVAGDKNTFIGTSAGANNVSGSANSYVGHLAGNSSIGTNNSFIGAYSGQDNTTGTENSFLGTRSGLNNSIGSHNTFLGYQSGLNNFGDDNIFIGRNAATTNTSGAHNTIIGTNANVAIPNLEYASAIGYGAVVNGFNSMVLGGTDLVTPRTSVNVGIGTPSPAANLHMEANTAEERVLINTTMNNVLSAVNLRSGDPAAMGGSTNDLLIMQNGPLTSGVAGLTGVSAMYTTAMQAYPPSAPALPWDNLAMIATKQSPLYIGTFQTQTNDYAQNIHIVTGVDVATSPGAPVLAPWECIRVNKMNGFVGIHTRTANTAGTTAEPQALFHVNLTNPANPGLNPLVNGIRFEGLLPALYPDVLVVDADGNVATRPYMGTTSGSCLDTNCYWALLGNTANSTHFLGTKNTEDLRIRTNNVLRGMVTQYGDWDLGNNAFTSSGSTSVAMGTQNIVDNSSNATAAGNRNNINRSDYSSTIGQLNTIALAPNAFTAGNLNSITNSTGTGNGCIALGSENIIDSSNESVVVGEANIMRNGHGSFIAGGHSTTNGAYNTAIGNHVSTSGLNLQAFGYEVDNKLSESIVMGFNNNRTTVLTSTGLAVQLDPTATGTYNPKVNFEVQAGIAPTTSPLPLPGGVRSNIRFHNLPDAPDSYPSVVIDPATGELFTSTMIFPPSYLVGFNQADSKDLAPISGAMGLLNQLQPKKGHVVTGDNTGTITYGFVNEDLVQVIPDAVNYTATQTDSGMVDQVRDVSYDKLVPILVQAIKDQQAQLDEQKKKIDELTALLTDNKKQIIDVELSDKDVIRLDQCAPNPADNFTSIGYYLPEKVQSAYIKFVSISGKVIKTVAVEERGEGKINVHLSDLTAGTYIYSLYADGQLAESKKMTVLK